MTSRRVQANDKASEPPRVAVSRTVADERGTIHVRRGGVRNNSRRTPALETSDRDGRYAFDVKLGTEPAASYRASQSVLRTGPTTAESLRTESGGAPVWTKLPQVEVVIGAGREPQQLLPNTTTPNLLEGFEARIKDPLHLLARAWQAGEFEAENTGGIAQVEIVASSIPINKIPNRTDPLGCEPLESIIETETENHSPWWNSSRLEYECDLRGEGLTLHVSEYDGRELDWYNFDVNSVSGLSVEKERTFRLLPRSLRVAGMPSARFWEFEDADTNVTLLASAEPNFLQMLLAEFLMIDCDNWCCIPVEMQPGDIQRLSRVRVIDSFGIATDLEPTLKEWGGEAWSVFTLSSQDGSSSKVDGSYLYLPNIVPTLAQTDSVEEIHFVPDELSNSVWAVEQHYTDQTGEKIDRGDVESAQGKNRRESATEPPNGSPMPVFRLMSPVPSHWIPYVPRRKRSISGSAVSEMYLRRARTDEAASIENPQYRTRILEESWQLREEEIPRTGLRVQRLWKYAKDWNGNDYFWIGRRKDISSAEHSAGLDFDYVVDMKG